MKEIVNNPTDGGTKPAQKRFSHEIVRESEKLLVRRIRVNDRLFETTLPSFDGNSDPQDEWWLQTIRGIEPSLRRRDTNVSRLAIADLFCGSGGFTNGLKLAAAAFGVSLDVKFAIDTDTAALGVYRKNHKPKVVLSRSVKDVIDSQVLIRDGVAAFYYDPALVNSELDEFVGKIDLVVLALLAKGTQT